MNELLLLPRNYVAGDLKRRLLITHSDIRMATSSAVASSSSAAASAGSAGHNPRPPELHSLQIRTKSIEQTLIPLVTQVTLLGPLFFFDKIA